ncbi:gamma-glutamyl-gamma-aminobutyrate hydrolase family protein [Skermania sp. ID1734]|uniref:gamma-glutamyl-gamma-aminobutyrate hydrolase family protein n=1 Tax=Skermania sp. ID1734 TaxID=2597516 RepID=UPI00117BF31E|nr:gamma-glutamyl-gamma-aminobutyrate hydrolase family protein [Skermania sp. ID1734]TSD99645.1 gamma-glutamyl-gamma-aminobutyrate hydrolase family protein [Skermania sp. ID1734]
MASSGSDQRPVIGITTYVERAAYGVWDNDCALLPREYIDEVAAADAVPVLIAPLGGGAASIVERIDALVLSGGSDVDPARYGHERQPQTVGIRPERDEFELELFAAARVRRIPVLGICRGLQLLNVALGGTLHQHLPDLGRHRNHLPDPGVFGTHTVRTEPGSAVESITGPSVTVHCHHHQGIAELGSGLRATAWAEDGTIEAVEAQSVLGVQWHPEQTSGAVGLFAALARHATNGSAG